LIDRKKIFVDCVVNKSVTLSRMTPLDRAISMFGTQLALAERADCFPQELSRWKKQGWVPKNRCEKTRDAINCEVPRALERGISTEIARPVSLADLNPKEYGAGFA